MSDRQLRHRHGRNQVCSFRGVKIVVDYFKNLGHRCTVFVPNNFVSRAPSSENIKVGGQMRQYRGSNRRGGGGECVFFFRKAIVSSLSWRTENNIRLVYII